MTNLSIASFATIESVEKTDDHSIKTIALFCCVGLLASCCMMAFGVDLSAGWMWM